MRAPARVREAARLAELVEGELGAFVAGVEALGAQVDGVGAVGDGGAHGVERAGGGEQLGNVMLSHKLRNINDLRSLWQLGSDLARSRGAAENRTNPKRSSARSAAPRATAVQGVPTAKLPCGWRWSCPPRQRSRPSACSCPAA